MLKTNNHELAVSSLPTRGNYYFEK